MSINLSTLFTSLGIIDGNQNAKNQYDFYYGVEWSGGTITYNQYDFFRQTPQGNRYDFFKQYTSETDFYKNTNDPNIYDYKTFYENAAIYFPSVTPVVWILSTGFWDDNGVWLDTSSWID